VRRGARGSATCIRARGVPRNARARDGASTGRARKGKPGVRRFDRFDDANSRLVFANTKNSLFWFFCPRSDPRATNFRRHFSSSSSFPGELGEYCGLVGEYCGLVGEYAGDVGEYAGDVGEYAGEVGE
jgi:hypothetical protein